MGLFSPSMCIAWLRVTKRAAVIAGLLWAGHAPAAGLVAKGLVFIKPASHHAAGGEITCASCDVIVSFGWTVNSPTGSASGYCETAHLSLTAPCLLKDAGNDATQPAQRPFRIRYCRWLN